MTSHCEKRSDEAIQSDGSPRLLSQAHDDRAGVIVATEHQAPYRVPKSVVTPQPQQTELWRVVVLNDPVNRMSYVVMVLRRVLGFEEERARRHMLEVHESGRSIVWTGTREQAEAHVFALQQWHLTAVIQPETST
jgi:ATP-dependent Clp protease adaptor protein ClpS